MIGTLGYVPPEVFTSYKLIKIPGKRRIKEVTPYQAKCFDIFSLGASLYEMANLGRDIVGLGRDRGSFDKYSAAV